MARSNGFNWTDKRNRELRNAVKRFNYYLEKASKDIIRADYLPEKASVKYLKTIIKNRRDLERTIRELNYSKNKSAFNLISTKSGNIITKYEYEITKRRVKMINRYREKEAEKYNIKIDAGEMGDLRAVDLLPKKSVDEVAVNDWEEFVKSTEKQGTYDYQDQKMENRKQGYIKALETVFGKDNYYATIVRRWDAEKFAKFFYSSDYPELNPGFVYDYLLEIDVKETAVAQAILKADAEL